MFGQISENKTANKHLQFSDLKEITLYKDNNSLN